MRRNQHWIELFFANKIKKIMCTQINKVLNLIKTLIESWRFEEKLLYK